MPDAEHLAQLQKGVDAWNAWRHENPDVYPDLNGADLSGGAYLRGANLWRANFSRAVFSQADLREAVLLKANLRGADLRGADLQGADLRGADLQGADLREANLQGADLREANLQGADLRQADLRGALLREADLSAPPLGGGGIGGIGGGLSRDLRGANLKEADLSEADLRGEDLAEEDLSALPLGGIGGIGGIGGSIGGIGGIGSSIGGIGGSIGIGIGGSIGGSIGGIGIGIGIGGGGIGGGIGGGLSRDLRGANLKEADLSEADLRGAKTRKDFTRADLALIEAVKQPRPPLPAAPVGVSPVDAAVFCPPHVPRGSTFLVQVILYPPGAEDAVIAQAHEADPAAERRGRYSLPLDVPPNTRVDLRLEMPDLQVMEPDAVVIWRGSVTAAQFKVVVPATVSGAKAIGRVRFAVAGIPAGTLCFQVELEAVGTAAAPFSAREAEVMRYRRAFASYSSEDRAEVLKRVQGMKTAGLSVFQDILDLEPGKRWARELYREIDNCDVFLLFWSRAAAASEWVAKEIAYTLERKAGSDEKPPAIQPVPIEGPPPPSPPEVLRHLHFNDALLAHIQAASSAVGLSAAAHTGEQARNPEGRMPDAEHVARLKQDVEAWNAWRRKNPDFYPDLSGADLGGAVLREADLSWATLTWASLSGANLHGANLREAILSEANLSGADLSEAILGGANLFRANLFEANLSKANLGGTNLREADLREADLSGTNLHEADLFRANLFGANLRSADLTKANLHEANLHDANLTGAILCEAILRTATLVNTDLRGANLTGCHVYGISAWDLELEGTKQQNLVITPENEPKITVDDVEVAQFVYLLLRNPKLRNVLDTIASKAVLILGRFTEERKKVLDAIREELRQRDYVPILFDFDKPASQDLTATISTLAHMARFIIADLTDPSSIPYELATVVPTTPVPVQPILLSGQREFTMFVDLQRRYRWVLAPHCYEDLDRLIGDLGERVIGPAETKVLELRESA